MHLLFLLLNFITTEPVCVRVLFQLWSSKVRVTWPLGQMDFIGSLSFLYKKQVFI